MQISKVNEWLQLVASIGVLIGIILVAQEIRQNNELAELTTWNNLYQGWEVISMSEYESDIHELFVKSIENPEDLSTVDMMKLGSSLTAIVLAYGQNSTAYFDYGLTDDPTEDFIFAAQQYFSGRFARSWFVENKPWLEVYIPEMTEVIGREIEATPVETSYGLVERIRSRL